MRWRLFFALIVAFLGLIIGSGLNARVWTLDEDGLSIVSGKLPYWDFTNLWAGSRMALDGHVGWLFDVEAYRAGLRAMLTPLLPDQEWSYPPSILLLGAPLATLPIFWAYMAWTFGTMLALYLSLRPLELPGLARLLVVLGPAALVSAMFGQNGALTAALLFAALAFSTERPILAGVFAGLLTIKPHLGVLIPFAYIASGNWRAFGSAAVTGVAMVAVTTLCFGAEVWPQFIAQTAPLMASILEAPFPQTYHGNAMTFFIFGRWLGLSVDASYALQGIFTLAAVAATVWLWRRGSEVTLAMRVVMTALLTICATPYGYTYDAVPLSVATVALLLAGASWPACIALAAVWIFPYFAHIPNYHGYGVTVLVPIALALYGFYRLARQPRIGQITVS